MFYTIYMIVYVGVSMFWPSDFLLFFFFCLAMMNHFKFYCILFYSKLAY